MASTVDTATTPLSIAVVGKYTHLSDSYLSLIESLRYSAISLAVKLNIVWIEASDLENDVSPRFSCRLSCLYLEAFYISVVEHRLRCLMKGNTRVLGPLSPQPTVWWFPAASGVAGLRERS